jgi:hypothetical protein
MLWLVFFVKTSLLLSSLFAKKIFTVHATTGCGIVCQADSTHIVNVCNGGKLNLLSKELWHWRGPSGEPLERRFAEHPASQSEPWAPHLSVPVSHSEHPGMPFSVWKFCR